MAQARIGANYLLYATSSCSLSSWILLPLLICLSTAVNSFSSDHLINAAPHEIAKLRPVYALTQIPAVKTGYYPSYSSAHLPASTINATLYTHLFFAFIYMDPTSFVVSILPDQELDLLDFNRTVTSINPSTQILLSIGGASASSSSFAQMAANATNRATFIRSSIALARQHGMAGLDLDWEYPTTATDMQNLGILISEWRAATLMDANLSNSSPLLLTAAVHYSATTEDSDLLYPVDAIASSLDWINIMAYDYYGPWTPSATGEQTALYAEEGNTLSTDYGITSWLKAGLPSYKAVLGLAMYGRSWMLKNGSESWIGAPAMGPGLAQPLSQEAGVLIYKEIVKFTLTRNVSTVYDKLSESYYSSDGRLWVGYDNPFSIADKVAYLMAKNLRGYMFWAVTFDDKDALSSSAFTTISDYTSLSESQELLTPSSPPQGAHERISSSNVMFPSKPNIVIIPICIALFLILCLMY